jgi:uncharacterized protein (DUF362 family)
VTIVGLAETTPSYSGIRPPFGPGRPYPELAALLGKEADAEPMNPVYAAVRSALRALGLDAQKFGEPTWNPLGALVPRGGRAVLKPNFIRHWNPTPGASVESVITHGSVIRAMADYALLAVGLEGSVAIAEASQQDCNFVQVCTLSGLDALEEHYEATCGAAFEVIDLRREWVTFRDGIVVARHTLPGDPLGYRVVDLGSQSFFHGSGIDAKRMRGADYDPVVTAEHHSNGRHEYLLSETVLRADLVINLPKLKTHKKTGVTLALKNLVGINGDKNWLPHHCAGPVWAGGDEFPGDRHFDRARSRLTDVARALLKRGTAIGPLRLARRTERALFGEDFVRSGNWYGNRTTWRMCLDLNRCLYYSDAKGLHLDASAPVRRVLTVLDGVVGGEGAGPLAPSDVPSGVVMAALDPVALDLAAVRWMGFDEGRIPKVREAMRDDGPRITAVRNPEEVRIVVAEEGSEELQELSLTQLVCKHPFQPHPGWRGQIERATS